MPDERPARPHAPGWPISSALLKLGIDPGDALAFINALEITPKEQRMARAASQLEELFRGYRRCDLPDGTVRWEHLRRQPRDVATQDSRAPGRPAG